MFTRKGNSTNEQILHKKVNQNYDRKNSSIKVIAGLRSSQYPSRKYHSSRYGMVWWPETQCGKVEAGVEGGVEGGLEEGQVQVQVQVHLEPKTMREVRCKREGAAPLCPKYR